MMKRIVSLLLVCFLCATLSPAALAEVNAPLLVDEADLLTQTQEQELLHKLKTNSDTYQVAFTIATVESLDGQSPERFASLYYNSRHFGYGENRDGVLLLVSMEFRDYYILSNGLGGEAVSVDETEDIGESVAAYLGDGDYVAAFNEFVDQCVYQVDGEINGFPFAFVKNLLISLGIGLALALIVTLVMKSKLKSVRKQPGATEYTKPGSMEITMANDFFLYHTINRRKKENNASNSAGTVQHGSGGKF